VAVAPRPRPSAGPLFLGCFLALLATHVLLMASLRLYPFLDMPNHLAAATIVRHAGEPDHPFGRYYAVDTSFPQPNTFHLLLTSSRLFPSVETANRVFHAAYVALVPLAVLLIIRRLGGNPWFALLAFLLLYNHSVNYGFVGFTIALPALLLLVLALVRLADRDDRPTRLAIAVLLPVLFVMHALAALFAVGLVLLTFAGWWWRSPALLARRALLVAPAVALVGAWWIRRPPEGEGGLARFLLEYYRDHYVPNFPRRAGLLVFDNYALFPGALGYAVAAAFALAIIVPALAWLVRDRRGLAAFLAAPRSRPVVVLGGWALACVLLLPDRLPGQMVLYERFAVLVLAACILAVAAGPWKVPARALAVALCLVAVLYTALRVDYFAGFDRRTADFTPELLPAGGAAEARLFGLIYDAHYRGRSMLVHFPNYYIVWRQGIAGTRLIDYRFGTVRRRADHEALPPYNEFLWIRPYADEYAGMEYLLVRGDVPADATPYLADFRPVRTAGAWSLYARDPARLDTTASR
jgi:hypothetical protein